MQWLPAAGRAYRNYLPLFPAAVELFDLDSYGLVISSSHCAAKSVIRSGRATHVCYCHSPMRYAWDQFDAYFGPEQVGGVRSRLLRPVMAQLARWDAATAGRVGQLRREFRYVPGGSADTIIAGRLWCIRAVDTGSTSGWPAFGGPNSYFLVVSAPCLQARRYRNRGVRLAGVPLRIVGRGPEEADWGACGATVEFLGWRTDDEVPRSLQPVGGRPCCRASTDVRHGAGRGAGVRRAGVALRSGGACETFRMALQVYSSTKVRREFRGRHRPRRSLRLDPAAIRATRNSSHATAS